MKKILPILLLFPAFFFFHASTFAEDPTATPTPTPSASSSAQDVRNKIQELEKKISDLRGQEKSLSSEITLMDSQINVAELRITTSKREIADTEEDIVRTTDKIAKLEDSLDQSISVFLNRIVATYKAGGARPMQILLPSQNINDLIKRESYLQFVQSHDRAILYQMQHSKMNYSDQKKLLEEKQETLTKLKAELEKRNKELEGEKDRKQKLLRETQGSEANFQKLLAQAKAQLAGFDTFVQSQGGASLLSNQTRCDDWGCYYNQRDSQWGALSLNGTKYTLASDGCLVTSMAMVLTHYKHKTIPIDINANPSNFASYYPAYLLFTISANGVTADRIGSQIDAALASGDPLVVGLKAYGGTHFVVLISGSNGNYKMHDPYIPNGNNISFTDHYSMKSIYEVHKVVIR